MKKTNLNYHVGLKRAFLYRTAVVVVFFIIFNILNIGAFYKGYSLNLDKVSAGSTGIDKILKNINMPLKIMKDLFNENTALANQGKTDEKSDTVYAIIKTSASKRIQEELLSESIYIPTYMLKTLCLPTAYFLDTSQCYNLLYYLCSNETVRYLLLFLMLMSVLPRGIPLYNNSYNINSFAFPNFLTKVGFFCFITECKWRLK